MPSGTVLTTSTIAENKKGCPIHDPQVPVKIGIGTRDELNEILKTRNFRCTCFTKDETE
ncbi:unnamed protein product [marine sediment metagenome]|uniref:Uncharacterized protein n=1 Tax=marine sediment metagenome TaxID=412755 RepID=X0VI67_9ZZZZ